MRNSLFRAGALAGLMALGAIVPGAQADEESEERNPLLLAGFIEAAPKFCSVEFNRAIRDRFVREVAEHFEVTTREARRAIRDMGEKMERWHVTGELESLCSGAQTIHDRYRAIYRLPRSGPIETPSWRRRLLE
ncbi:MAG: hypothetical protein LAT81_07775 [Oceanicaulis sp.]|nr:hypothetical protein [Oceanicaulis sp.]